MLRKVFWAVPALLLAAGSTAYATSTSSTQGGESQRCEEQAETSQRSVGRGILGGLARGALGRFGGRTASVARSWLPVNELLDEAIAGLLDCQEQQKAAEATNEAVRGGVGTTTSWESESRPGVRGSSTVTAQDDGGQCMTVTDVVIVDGEETTAPKRLCRRPPNNRYVRV